MKFKNILLITILAFSLISCKSNSQENFQIENPIVKKNPTSYKGMRYPKPVGYVNDFENILSETEKSELEKLIMEYEKSTTKEIVIVTIDSTFSFNDIHRFSTELANEWGVGKMDKNNGLTIVVSKKLRKAAISTGYGTEKILTDPICKKVLVSIMVPEFKKEEFYIGIKKGLDELIDKWK